LEPEVVRETIGVALEALVENALTAIKLGYTPPTVSSSLGPRPSECNVGCQKNTKGSAEQCATGESQPRKSLRLAYMLQP
jgi:hypothetical protein